MYRFIKVLLLVSVLLLQLPTVGLAQPMQPQPFDPLSAVTLTDASRLMNEIDTIIKLQAVLQAQKAWWEDACRSTPECGGPKPEAQK
jgi:hypothetical protein